MTDTDAIRPAAADFHPGAEVFSQDDQHVGALHSTVIDEQSMELQAVVIKESKRFAGTLLAPGTAMMNDQLLVPAGVVKRLDRARVELTLTADQLRRLPPYLTYRRRYPSAADYLQEVETVLGGMPGVVRETEEAHKAATEIEIYADEPVMLGHSGRRIGKVAAILFEDKSLVGIVMKPEGWFKEPVILPRRFLERTDDAALFVQLTHDELEQLKPFSPPA
ncbi:MAG TPA: hypothetical protein VGR61_01170 [Candidatus Dormibacteraeota bacterium]|nr:hypothetical protein [Candidatus Dormibacteraeota bacterium]